MRGLVRIEFAPNWAVSSDPTPYMVLQPGPAYIQQMSHARYVPVCVLVALTTACGGVYPGVSGEPAYRDGAGRQLSMVRAVNNGLVTLQGGRL